MYRKVKQPWSSFIPIIEVAFIFSLINDRLSKMIDIPPKDVIKPQAASLWYKDMF